MKTKLVLALLSTCVVAGSAAAFAETLYPVQGPLAAQASPPAMKLNFHGSTSGNFSLVQTSGETFQGKWASVTPAFVNNKTPENPASYLPQPNLAFAWDAVYGQGYFVGQVLGTRIRQAVATGDKGTVVQVECLYGDQRFPGVPNFGFNGVAVDSKGNIYKVVFP
jgi:hypothetical protein